MRVKLEDVCERGSSNIKQSDIIKMSGNYPIYGASGLAGKVNFYHQEQPYVAVVKDGAGIGRTTLNPAKSSVIGTMQYLIPKKNVLPEYLFYVVSYMHLEKYYTGATIPHIYFKDYKNEEFNLDNIEKQLEIIDVLGRCKKVIEARKQELVELDSLTKARFVELFGDPVANPMHWPVKRLKELAIQINSGNTPKGGSENYVEKGITFFRSQNVWKDRLEMDDIAYIDEKTHESMKRSSLKHGDILMTKTGRINTENSSLGRAALYEGEDDMANVNGHVYFIRLKEGVNNKFVLRVLVSPEYRDLIRSVCVGGIDKRQLNKEHIEEFPIIYPPSEMIDNYIEFVEQVNKSKFDTMTFAPIYAIINLYLHTYFYQGRR
jgi:type I restriction enzyme S subunit|uniref:restriction endonuclease subunit S n=1 Tax=Agathobacter rectalis TaxID=39491 RepID=UPI004026BD61